MESRASWSARSQSSAWSAATAPSSRDWETATDTGVTAINRHATPARARPIDPVARPPKIPRVESGAPRKGPSLRERRARASTQGAPNPNRSWRARSRSARSRAPALRAAAKRAWQPSRSRARSTRTAQRGATSQRLRAPQASRTRLNGLPPPPGERDACGSRSQRSRLRLGPPAARARSRRSQHANNRHDVALRKRRGSCRSGPVLRALQLVRHGICRGRPHHDCCSTRHGETRNDQTQDDRPRRPGSRKRAQPSLRGDQYQRHEDGADATETNGQRDIMPFRQRRCRPRRPRQQERRAGGSVRRNGGERYRRNRGRDRAG